MNNEHAKIVLSVYRPNGQDANDPFFAASLKQATQDPALAAWFKEEQRFDAAFAERLRMVSAPPSAKTMIKATMGASTGRPRRWWPLALAAGLAAMIALSVILKSRPKGLSLPPQATVAQLASELAEHHATMGLMSGDMDRIRQWIANRKAPVPEDLPGALVKLMALGCETWETSRGRISLICFMGEGKQMVHLYVFENAADFPGLPERAEARRERQGKWSLALWQRNGRAYVLGLPGEGGIEVGALLEG